MPGFRVVERDGWVWIRSADAGSDASGPPAYPRDRTGFWFEYEYVVEAPVDLILENGLDCSHTGFAHEGLFRSAPQQYVTTRVEETPTGVRATMEDERSGGTRDTRSRLGGRKTIRHVDEIILPHTLRVEYTIGRRRLVTVLICTPEREMRTRVFNRTGVVYGAWTPFVGRYVRRVARKVIRQDVEILNSQGERIRQFGHRDFRAVMADQPAAWMQRVLRAYGEGRTPAAGRPPREVVYRL